MSFNASKARQVKSCPFCKELISRSATKCPHCQSNVFVPMPRKRRPMWLSNFMLGVYAGAAMIVGGYILIRWWWGG